MKVMKLNEMFNDVSNPVISTQVADNIKKQFNDFLNSLDELNNCKDYNELESQGNRLKSYLENFSEQIDNLIFAHSPEMIDYLLDATKEMLSDTDELDDKILYDITCWPKNNTIFDNLEEYNDNDRDLSDWGVIFKNFGYHLRLWIGGRDISGRYTNWAGSVAAYMGYSSVNAWAQDVIGDENADLYNDEFSEIYDKAETDYHANVNKKYPVSLEFTNKKTGATISVTDNKILSEIFDVIKDNSNMLADF